MLVIRPTEDGRLHLSNNRRSDVARDEATARSLAYRWGHTDISINKALAEMRSAGREPERGWRVTRPAATEAPAPTVRVAAERPVAETGASPAPRRTRTPRSAAKPAPEPAAEPVTEPAASAPTPEEPAASPARPPRKRSRRRPEPAEISAADNAAPVPPAEPAAAEPAAEPLAESPAKPTRRSRARRAPEPTPPAEPTSAAADPRREALKLFREGVRELAAVERATLPFARAPWSDLREMADYIAACLEGKKPKTGWTRAGR